MGKQTNRQKAKMARDVVPECPDHLCCLPHCEERGVKLECGHLLCGMDLLKLTRFVGQLQQFTITCPMCRKLCIHNRDCLMDIMEKNLSFRCATFKCGCVTPGCNRSYTATLRPCKSHGKYTCDVCRGDKASTLETRELGNDAEEPTPRPNPRRMPYFYNLPNWGLTDAQFDEVMVIYKRSIGGMSAARERSYRLARTLHGLPGDFADDMDLLINGDAEQTNMFKFLKAYAEVML